MKRFALALLLALFAIQTLDASPNPRPPPVRPPPVTLQSESIQMRLKFAEICSRPEFQSLNEDDLDSSFQGWISWIYNEVSARWDRFKYAREMQNLSYLLNSLFVLLSIVGLIILFRRLTRRTQKAVPEPVQNDPIVPPKEELELLDQKILAAELSSNFLEALSAAWRQLLMKLASQKRLPIDPSRTNHELLSYLRSQRTPLPELEAFALLVDAFDTFFYGRLPLPEKEWQLLRKKIAETSQLFSIGAKT